MVDFTVETLDIFFKLWRNRCFNAKRTIYEKNLMKGFPPENLGQMQGELDNLIKKGFIVRIPKPHGKKVFINPYDRNIIEKALKKAGYWD